MIRPLSASGVIYWWLWIFTYLPIPHSHHTSPDKKVLFGTLSLWHMVCKSMNFILWAHSTTYFRNTNPKSKIGFKTSEINISCRNIYWSQFFNQILIYSAGLITLGLAAVVLAALDSRAFMERFCDKKKCCEPKKAWTWENEFNYF